MQDLNIKQEKAIQELLISANLTKAAKKADVTMSTMYRWLKEENFKACLQDNRKQIVEGTIQFLQLLGNKALNVLSEILEDKKAPKTAKVNAAKTILEMMIKLNEQDTIIKKINELELILNERII